MCQRQSKELLFPGLRQFSNKKSILDRETSLTRVGSIRLGDTSMPRMKEVALPSYSAASAAVS